MSKQNNIDFHKQQVDENEDENQISNYESRNTGYRFQEDQIAIGLSQGRIQQDIQGPQMGEDLVSEESEDLTFEAYQRKKRMQEEQNMIEKPSFIGQNQPFGNLNPPELQVSSKNNQLAQKSQDLGNHQQLEMRDLQNSQFRTEDYATGDQLNPQQSTISESAQIDERAPDENENFDENQEEDHVSNNQMAVSASQSQTQLMSGNENKSSGQPGKKKGGSKKWGFSKDEGASQMDDLSDQEEYQLYKSRTAKLFDDSNSNDDGKRSTDEDPDVQAQSKLGQLKSNQAYYKKMQEQNDQQLELETQKAKLGANADSDVKPNRRFRNFNDIFTGMSQSTNVVTSYPLISVIITYDSISAVTVTKKSDTEYFIEQYNLDDCSTTFEEKIRGKYIKLKEVEQNERGDYFAVTYIDDGKFRLRTFGTKTRTKDEIEQEELKINECLDLDDHTIPIYNFPDPFISCTFVNNDLIFVTLFHNATLTHHHFVYNYKIRQITSHASKELNCNNKNFPWKCFYSPEQNEVYSFYRQGQSFRVPIMEVDRKINEEKPAYTFQKITNKDNNTIDLGQMYLFENKVLVARSSSQILFFRLVEDEITKQQNWEHYWTIAERGNIFFIKGNDQMQITTDEKIFFYMIHPNTYEPQLENVMNNFMSCTQMMFGSKGKYCITFKTNQRTFDIYRRKYEHNYRVNVVQDNLDGSKCLAMQEGNMNDLLVCKDDTIKFYDCDSYEEIESCRLKFEMIQQQEGAKNEIIGMQKSNDDNYLAILTGHHLATNEQKPNQLFIYKRHTKHNTNEHDTFVFYKRLLISSIPGFSKFSMQFHFKLARGGHSPSTLMFATPWKILEYNFETNKLLPSVHFEVPLGRQPEFFWTTEDQQVFIVASMDDGIYFNSRNREFVDLDLLYSISNIREITHDPEDGAFYILANKYSEKLGLFLIRFEEDDPQKYKFVLRIKNKLDIADADIAVMRNQTKKYKELIISYKTIFMNTYTIYVIDLSTKEMPTLFKHQSFQLWESKIYGVYLPKSHEYVTLNSEGISIASLGGQQKRLISSGKAKDKKYVCHSLETVNYLKVDPKNFILFEFDGDNKIISIVQQHTKYNQKTGEETGFDPIYKIRIHDITLRELLLFQSLYVCKTQSDILQLVQSQPNPQVFYKSFLELDCSNMVSILCFDSRSMKELLDKENMFFDKEFPIFYKNRIQKTNNRDRYFYRSAVDGALKNNQIRAVGYIIDHIVKHQNHHVSSFLFTKNFKKLLEKGLDNIADLLKSDIFCFTFDHDEWPSTHTDKYKYRRPFNGSIFELREAYRKVFPEDKFAAKSDEDDIDASKVYKVSYKINMLPMLGEYITIEETPEIKKNFVNQGLSLMELCTEAVQEHESESLLSIFEANNFIEVIDFKWDSYARPLHMLGCMMHFFYVAILVLYINQIYVHNTSNSRSLFETSIIFGVIYPAVYDMTQMYQAGWRNYFKQLGNYLDLIYVYGSVINVILQKSGDPQNFINKLLMTIILVQQIYKTFFFLRIFRSLSHIVTMIQKVIFDLRVFLIFYIILLFLFSMIFAVIGLANRYVPGGLQDYVTNVWEKLDEDEQPDLPNQEYEMIGALWGSLATTLRVSLGDFDFEASTHLNENENILYWVIWILVVVMTCIVFLNFIIAEASASYTKVKQNLDAMIAKEKAELIAEAETILPVGLKTPNLFPKYIIIREVEE